MITTIIICCMASFIAGFIDSIAGGGGLISLPALLLSGMPPHSALGTSKFAATFGTGLALLNFARSNLIVWKVATYGIGFALIGSYGGSELALLVNSDILGKIIIFLLPIAMLATLSPLKSNVNQHNISSLKLYIILPIVCLIIGLYDGFFGPGTGSFFIIALHWILGLGLIQASATSKVFNFVTNICALVVFLWNGKVVFMLALPMAASNMLGNWLGSRMAIKGGPAIVRKFLIVSMSLLLISLIYQYFFSTT